LFVHNRLQLHNMHGTKWWGDSEHPVEKVGLICFKAFMCRSKENHERFRSRCTKSNIDVRLRQLYCVSPFGYVSCTACLVKQKGIFDTLRALECLPRCLRIWSKDFDEIWMWRVTLTVVKRHSLLPSLKCVGCVRCVELPVSVLRTV
jgi:hypothetical protein